MTPSSLTNPDLAPVPREKRTWNTLTYFALWVGMSIQIPTYMMASSLIQGGMSAMQALFTIFLGNMIVLVPLLMNGHVGAKYGIPYPVFARASFGTRGANIPAILRALVACGWFGIQTWIGGQALYVILITLYPEALSWTSTLTNAFDVGLAPFLCFLAFWLMNIYVIWRGIECLKMLEIICAPLLIACGIGLLVWAGTHAGGFGSMLAAPSQFASNSDFMAFFFPSLTGIIGFWATLSLNIPDFTRYSVDQKAHMWGQILGLPSTMTLFAFVGVAVTSSTVLLYGEAIWDPVALVQKFDSTPLVMVALVGVLIATLSTNVAANVVGPANDFSNLAPRLIDFKCGGYITGIIGILIMPWKLIQDPSGYIFTWLIGYSALLGPIAGILMTDYYLLRKMRLEVEELFNPSGTYSYRNGFNTRALVALAVGILPNIPGFCAQINILPEGMVPEALISLYHYAWFIGLLLAGGCYRFLMRDQNTVREFQLQRI